MPKRSRKDADDPNVVAFKIIGQLEEPHHPKKNPAAVALGRLGGLKGGKARAATLSKAERSESAKKAARARWGKNRKSKVKNL
jgi:hypothetical protein